MTTNDIINSERVAHVRELKAEVARLKDELVQTRAELEAVRSHFALALVAARAGDEMPAGGSLLIVDGWNALLGSASLLAPAEKALCPRAKEMRLEAIMTDWLAAHPSDHAWIVFDGAHPGGRTAGRLRVTFTGGTGAHRADHFVCDFLRMRRFVGASYPVCVVTEDKDFQRDVQALGVEVASVESLRPEAHPPDAARSENAPNLGRSEGVRPSAMND